MRRTSTRKFPRTARLNESLREVLADALEAIGDERLELVTVTGVEIDPDLRHATVYYSALTTAAAPDDVSRALEEYRVRLQGEIARQLVLKRTPRLAFAVDPAITNGLRIEEILATMARPADPQAGSDEPGPV